MNREFVMGSVVRLKTTDIKPRNADEIVKPAEIIGVGGLEEWTLADRRTWNLLLKNAWGDRLENPTADFFIPLAELRGLHDSNDRLKASLEKLQTTLVHARLDDGSIRTVQMLGGCDIWDSDRAQGVLKYDFHRKLVPILRRSEIYARLELKVINSFTSKYSLALYEEIARRVGLHKSRETVPLKKLRSWLSVPEGKLLRWPDLWRYAIKAAVDEVNSQSPFDVSIVPVKRGRSIVGVDVSWFKKDPFSPAEQAAAFEVNRHSVGRVARRKGQVEVIPHVTGELLEQAKDIIRDSGKRLNVYTLVADWRDLVKGMAHKPDNLAAHWLAFVRGH
jgi:plasmid replication initiation protein